MTERPDPQVDPRFALAQAGDEEALAALAADHQGLVGYFVRGLRSVDPAVDDEDLRQAGQRGLVEAIRRYQPVGPFSSFAKRHIRGRAVEELRLRKSSTGAPHVSWDATEEERSPLRDRVADDRLIAADEQCLTDERATGVRRALARLPDRERAILTSWAAGQTFTMIGTTHGLTKQRVHQIYRRGLRRMRVYLSDFYEEESDGDPD